MGYGSLDPKVLKQLARRERNQREEPNPPPAAGESRVWNQLPLPTMDTEYSAERLESCLKALERSGDVRGIFVQVGPDGEYHVTVKLTLAGRGRVYRHGRIEALEDLPGLLLLWCAKGYWTPDRQP